MAGFGAEPVPVSSDPRGGMAGFDSGGGAEPGGGMAGFEGPRYRATVSRFTASSRAIRRPDKLLRANALIASQVLMQRWFIRPHEPNNRARSAMNLFTSDSGWCSTALYWLVLTAL
jgi:hypothetical protein